MHVFLLGFCSSKDCRSTRMSLESVVTLLTSGEVSDPSTLGYGGGPSQVNPVQEFLTRLQIDPGFRLH